MLLKLRPIFILCLLAFPVMAKAADNLSPRAEVSVKGGSERSTLTTEFWAPLAQKSDRVVYTDLRLMGDDDDNREGNLGIGYRQVYEPTNSVLGIHGWIDRRRTEHNSTFHQVTLGVESLGNKIDLRANGYIPLNGGRVVTTPNLGSATPYLAGNGLFYDTTGSINETPQYGIDAEAGYRLPIFEKQIDTLRVYGGGYHFFRSNTENVTGFRIRTEAQINQIVSIGARFQHDGPRGSQGFLEATLRFPFSAKKLYQKSGLVSRLDESPERDIDIVTASKVDIGLRKEILNASGTQQRILYVDNTQTNGDGTKEHPFNNLQSAQAALQANDILYIFHGDGTTHNMDQGITISQPGVQLIGSGSALTVSGLTFLNATSAPVITNTQAVTIDADTKKVTGNGVYILADNARVSGLTVSGAQGIGIFVRMEGSHYSSVVLDNNNVLGNIQEGITINVFNGGSLDNATITNNTTNNNGRWGILATAGQVGIGHIGTVTVENNVSNGNALYGVMTTSDNSGSSIDHISIRNNSLNNSLGNAAVFAAARTGGYISDIDIENNILANNFRGINFNAVNTGSDVKNIKIANNIITNSGAGGAGIESSVQQSAQTEKVIIENNQITNSATIGLYINAITNAHYGDVTASGNTLSGNTSQGIFGNITGATISNLNILNNNSLNNQAQGVLVSTGVSGQISTLTVSGNNASNSLGSYGIQVNIQNNFATLGSAVFANNITSNNVQYGMNIAAATGGVISDLTVNGLTANSNGSNGGLYIQTNSGTIGNVTLSNISAMNNISSYGVRIGTANSGIIGNAILSNITTTNNSNGIGIGSGTSGTINNVTLTNVTTTSNRSYGIIVQNTGAGQLNNIGFNTVAANNNTTNGIYVLSQGAGTAISNITTTNVTANNNTSGVVIQGDSSSIINGANLSTITATGNTQNGVVLNATAGGSLQSINLTNTTSSSNGAAGLLVSSNTAASPVSNIIVANNNFLSNATNGIYLNKGSTVFVVDAGGGSLGSAGGNRVFGNTGTEIRVDGGYAFVARNDYWGGGDLIAGEKTLNGGSTVDSTGFLTADPRP